MRRGGAGHPVSPSQSPVSPAGLTEMTGRPRILVYLLLGRSLRHRYNGHVCAAFGFVCELNLSIDEREQGVIGATADIAAGMPGGAALARKDIAGKRRSRRPTSSSQVAGPPSRDRCVKIRLLSYAP